MEDPLFSREEDRAFWIDISRRAAADPRTWLLTARGLRQSADILWAHYRGSIDQTGPRSEEWFCLQPALLLAGYSLESLAKGLLILRRPQVVGTERLDRIVISHEVQALLTESGLAISAEEKRVVDRLLTFVMWAGRYPVPKNFADLVPEDAGGTRALEPDDAGRAAEWRTFGKLYWRLESLLDAGTRQ